MKRILFVAAENAALPGGKVGGVGDVVRDLPLALADEGLSPTVITPAYGMFSELPGTRVVAHTELNFAGMRETVAICQVAGADDRVTHLVMDHPRFSPQGPGRIYCQDGSERPFAADAGKFAFFCAAVAAYLNDLDEQPDIVHLHDWHAAMLLVLRHYAAATDKLVKLRCVFTIHNLALQGIRPLRGDESSFEAWFPDLSYDEADVGDPRYTDCINPMAAAIRLADKVNTVSPSYAKEILRPNDPDAGFSGAEGLEQDTQQALASNRLVGILNGCMYPAGLRIQPSWRRIAAAIRALPASVKITPDSKAVIQRFARHRPQTVLTSVGRITSQKVQLLMEPVKPELTALEAILRHLGEDSLLILLGSGDAELEARIEYIFSRHRNALFIRGYNEELADTLYAAGDLFLMPSSFEPCGISQMLAMREGQPCLVHKVGGLSDTVDDGESGFVFSGTNPVDQAQALVATAKRALTLHSEDPRAWRRIQRAAAAKRFSWTLAARSYVTELYEVNNANAR